MVLWLVLAALWLMVQVTFAVRARVAWTQARSKLKMQAELTARKDMQTALKSSSSKNLRPDSTKNLYGGLARQRSGVSPQRRNSTAWIQPLAIADAHKALMASKKTAKKGSKDDIMTRTLTRSAESRTRTRRASKAPSAASAASAAEEGESPTSTKRRIRAERWQALQAAPAEAPATLLEA